MKFILSSHAVERMEKWGITQEMVELTLMKPEGRIWDRLGQYFYQRTFLWKNGHRHLVRVLVDENQIPNKVITVYHTSRAGRY